MKPFVVDWDDEATRMLADIFVNASDPNALGLHKVRPIDSWNNSREPMESSCVKVFGRSSFCP